MSRVVSVFGVGLVALWVVAHLLSLGPVLTATEAVLAWVVILMAVTAVIASVSVLGCGLILGATSPAWLRFVAHARSVAAALGGALLVVGLLHYRDTEPHGEIGWVIAGALVLMGAVVVHLWLAAAERRNLS